MCDVARKKSISFFVTFVNFFQTYDLVPLQVLFRVLKHVGCDLVMLTELMSMNALTENVVGIALVAVNLGVRQVSTTFCLLSIIFVNDLIMMLKEEVGVDGFMSWFHVVLMSDIVFIATARRKNRILKQ